MKKTYLFSILSIIGICNTTTAFTPWWEQPTVCRLDPSRCYPTMGTGFDTELWDSDAKCWGQKIICADALTSGNEDRPIKKQDTTNSNYVSSDFDINTLSTDGDCYGKRKTRNDGTETMVNGKYVQVWCHGILDNADETLPNGEVTFGTQPTCKTLAEYGYVAVENGRCYGKYFNPNQYHIDCGDKTTTPSRLIILNGADINAPMGNAPATMADANTRFEEMYKTSKEKKSSVFKN